MGITIAELFVNLGVKGDNQANKALKGVKAELGEIKSTSLEVKAGILAVIYGLEQMMTWSAKMGTSMMNFERLTGISAETLQRWQYAARQVGVGNEEIEASFKGVQEVMGKMISGQGAPSGLYDLANTVGFDRTKAMDTIYVLNQLQKYAQLPTNPVRTDFLKSFHLNEGTIAAMRENAFRPEIFAKANIFHENELSQLNKIDVAWANLGQQMKMAMGHLTSKHGLETVQNIEKMSKSVLSLADSLLKLAERFKVFQAIGMVFEGWSLLLDPDREDGLAGIAKGLDEYFGGAEEKGKDTSENYKDRYDQVLNHTKKMKELKRQQMLAEGQERKESLMGYSGKVANGPNAFQIAAPILKPLVSSGYSAQERGMNFIMNNYGVKDSHESVGLLERDIQRAARQSSALARGK